MNAARERTPFMDPGEEAARVREAQQGSTADFAELVRAYQRPIVRVAYGLTRNAADADDLAQETFVRAWQAIGRFRVGEPLYPWLARIAVNLAVSLHRRRARRPEQSIEPLVEAGRQWGVDDDPAGHAERSEYDAMLRAAIAELAPEHQAVLALRAAEDMSYDEIARVLGIPAGTVMSRLARARLALRERLKARTGDTR
jgi:RNA polymerase sigma-70 factor (ECF subfamily)